MSSDFDSAGFVNRIILEHPGVMLVAARLGETSLLRRAHGKWQPRELPATIKWGEGRAAYETICARLNRQYQLAQAQRTVHESEIFKMLCKATQRRIVSGAWMGNHCLDLFLPAVQIERQVGLVIEVDGGIHATNMKNKKDTRRDLFLAHIFGLHPFVVFNQDKNGLLRRLRTALSAPPPRHEAQERLWRRIHTFTIGIHATTEELALYFGIHAELTIELHNAPGQQRS